MGELKPIGSEKLKGDAKIQRILELTYFNSQVTSTAKPNNGAEYISETVNGVYGIVKEKDGYYVKKGLNENTLDYIGGLFMKNKNKFHSYSEALKRLDYIQGQETLNEATKYVLKVNKPSVPTEAPMPQPAMDAPAPGSAPTGDVPSPDDMESSPETGDGGVPSPDEMGDTGMDDTGMEDTGMENDEDFLKIIQKLTGKLGQKLRGYQDKLEGDDVKYVINSVLSALDLDKLEMNDKEEILNQFEDDEEGTDEFGSEPSPETEVPAGDMGGGAPGDDTELGEDMDALEQLINAPFGDDDEEEEYTDNSSMEDTTDLDFDKYLSGQDGFNINNDEELPIDEEDDEFNTDNETDVDLEPELDSDLDTGDDEPSGMKFSDEPSIDTDDDEDTDIGEPKKNEVDREFAKFLQQTNNLGDGFGDEDEDEDLPVDYNMNGEMSEQDENVDDSQVREIEIDELTNMINNTVKETLGKYFK
jgi:hypothetical protein